MTLFAALVGAQASDTEPRNVDICRLFENPSHWNGIVVRVLGAFEVTTGEGGPWLAGEKCRTEISVKGVEFPNMILLTDPQAANRLHDVGFSLDEHARGALRSATYQVIKDKARFEIEVVGLFETRIPLESLVNEKGRFKYNGFGHMGGAPAQILIRNVSFKQVGKK